MTMEMQPSETFCAPQICARPLGLLLSPPTSRLHLPPQTPVSSLLPGTRHCTGASGLKLSPSVPTGSSPVTQAGHMGHGCLWDRVGNPRTVDSGSTAWQNRPSLENRVLLTAPGSERCLMPTLSPCLSPSFLSMVPADTSTGLSPSCQSRHYCPDAITLKPYRFDES